MYANLEVECLEARCLLSVRITTPLPGVVQVIGGPSDAHAVVVTERQLTVDDRSRGAVTERKTVPLDAGNSLWLELGDGENTVLNYSDYPTLVLLGRGQNTFYGGTGPTLVEVLPGLPPHGFDAVVVLGPAAVDVRGGPALVIARPDSAVAADVATDVFRFLTQQKGATT